MNRIGPGGRLAFLGLLLLALTLGALALHVPGEGTVGTAARKDWFVALLGLAALVQFAAIATVRRGVPRSAVWLVLAIALALRTGPLLAPPFLSSDVYRYAWDGRVQAAGFNPYAYLPADPALASLRDTAVYPHINRADTAPTIYPPAAQILFAAIGWAAPGVTAVKVMMVGFEALLLLAAALVLRRSGLPEAWIVVWAWNPLAIWAFAGNGHIDAAAAGLLAVALLLIRWRGGLLAGVALGAAILTKFLPLAAAPVFWPLGKYRAATATIITAAVLYACYASVGPRVLGFLPGYSTEEGLADGSGFWLLAGLAHLGPLPGFATQLYLAVAALMLGALAIWIAFIRPPTTDADIWRAAGWLMAGVTVAISPHYPWYFAWLALPAIVAPSRALVWLSTSPVLLYVNPFEDRFTWACLVYLPALALAIADHRWPAHAPIGETA